MTNLSLAQFRALTKNDGHQFCRDIERKSSFRFESLGHGLDLLPTFRHRSNSIRVKLVPRGAFLMGLSEAEELAARRIKDPPPLDIPRMRPVHGESVKTLFVSAFPLSPDDYQQITGRSIPVDASRQDGLVKLPFGEAEELAALAGGRLLSEAEWEYCCRATTQSLFFFGDLLPPPPRLDALVRVDSAKDQVSQLSNRFGLFGMLCGQWCSDHYRVSYEPGAMIPTGFRAVRGGGADYWPWQSGVEWAGCVSANRVLGPDLTGGQEPLVQAYGKVRARRGVFIKEYAVRVAWPFPA